MGFLFFSSSFAFFLYLDYRRWPHTVTAKERRREAKGEGGGKGIENAEDGNYFRGERNTRAAR